MNLDVSRESLRVLEQGGAGAGWGLGKTTWQPSEGNTEAGRPETVAAVRRAARGWGERSRGRLPALWPAVGPPTSGPRPLLTVDPNHVLQNEDSLCQDLQGLP